MNNKNLVLEKYLTEIEFMEISLNNIVIFLTTIFFWLIVFIASTKSNKELSDKIFSITNKKYDVRVINIETPNAFCFAEFSNSIFITTGLIKLLNERELISILLHEASHFLTIDALTRYVLRASGLGLWYKIIELLADRLKNGKRKYLILFVALSMVGLYYIPQLILGRYRELKPDKYTIEFGYDKDLISASSKIKIYNENEARKPNLFNKYFIKLKEFINKNPENEQKINNLFNKIELCDAIVDNNKTKVKNIIKETFKNKI